MFQLAFHYQKIILQENKDEHIIYLLYNHSSSTLSPLCRMSPVLPVWLEEDVKPLWWFLVGLLAPTTGPVNTVASSCPAGTTMWVYNHGIDIRAILDNVDSFHSTTKKNLWYDHWLINVLSCITNINGQFMIWKMEVKKTHLYLHIISMGQRGNILR